MSPTELIRVDKNFKKEIEEIIKERERRGFKRISYRKITSLILRHKYWNKVKLDKIREDIINYEDYEEE